MGRFLGGFDPVPQPPSWTGCIKGVRGASGASTLCFGKNFIKQKLLGTPNLVGAGHLFRPQIWIWKDLGPMSSWSHGHSYWRGVDKIKVVVFVPNGYLVRSDTTETTVYSDRLSINYPPISDAFDNREYFFCIIQTIQLWHYWEIACSISINNIFFSLLYKAPKMGDDTKKKVSPIIQCHGAL